MVHIFEFNSMIDLLFRFFGITCYRNSKSNIIAQNKCFLLCDRNLTNWQNQCFSTFFMPRPTIVFQQISGATKFFTLLLKRI